MCKVRRRPDEVALTERAAENGAKRACTFVPLQQGQYPAPVATLRTPESLQLLPMHSHLAKEQKLEKAKKKKSWNLDKKLILLLYSLFVLMD
jgi:hypothetical protein